MRYSIDHIIRTDTLPSLVTRASLERYRQVALELEEHWIPFPALEPAYACGRAAGMSGRVDHWLLYDAVVEARFDTSLDRDVVTLYVKEGAPSLVGYDETGDASDTALLYRFAAGVDPRSNYWPGSIG